MICMTPRFLAVATAILTIGSMSIGIIVGNHFPIKKKEDTHA